MPKHNSSPTWTQYTAAATHPDLTAAIAVIETDNWNQLSHDAARWTRYRDVRRIEAELDWEAWIKDVNERGRGWSSAQFRLFDLAAALATDRPIQVTETLRSLGNWEPEVWRILVAWGTGGNNREASGRSEARVVRQLPSLDYTT